MESSLQGLVTTWSHCYYYMTMVYVNYKNRQAFFKNYMGFLFFKDVIMVRLIHIEKCNPRYSSL